MPSYLEDGEIGIRGIIGHLDTSNLGWPPRARKFTRQATQGFFDAFYFTIPKHLGASEIGQMRHEKSMPR